MLRFSALRGYPYFNNTNEEIRYSDNANRVIRKHEKFLLALKEHYPDQLKIRVSLDHFTADVHNHQRGKNAFEKTMEQMLWFYENNFDLSLAGRSLMGESNEDSLKRFGNFCMLVLKISQ